MADQNDAEKPKPGLEKAPAAESKDAALNARLPAAGEVENRSSDSDKAKKLTTEEQMALYEKDLKENDWGHQPC